MSPNEVSAPSIMDPHGPAAEVVARLGWQLFGLSVIVVVFVVICLAIALFRRRQPEQNRDQAPAGSNSFVLLAGVGMPLVVLGIVFVGAIRTQMALSNPVDDNALTIEVVGYQWWWEVLYPDTGIRTANEIHLPVGQPVRVQLRSADVIHSFWVPELQGKMDLVPGYENEFWLQADRAGVYRGLCAEFCGIQHANMMFLIFAEPVKQFDVWMQHQQQPASVPDSAEARRGERVFFEAECDYCHTIQGTEATGDAGPDLTHVATRRSLAAAMMANTPENLAAWITNAQHLKPGNLMPATAGLSDTDLQALLAYLEQLD